MGRVQKFQANVERTVIRGRLQKREFAPRVMRFRGAARRVARKAVTGVGGLMIKSAAPVFLSGRKVEASWRSSKMPAAVTRRASAPVVRDVVKKARRAGGGFGWVRSRERIAGRNVGQAAVRRAVVDARAPSVQPRVNGTRRSYAPNAVSFSGMAERAHEVDGQKVKTRGPRDFRRAARVTGVDEAEARFAPLRLGRDSVTEPADIRSALDDYFTRQARLPPAGGAAFDPRLTPAWAGVKIPV
jgi:hypothetical protein